MADLSVASLTLTDTDVEKLCQLVFSGSNSGKLNPEAITKILDYAKTPEGKKLLKTYVNSDLALFLHGLKFIDDSKGLILHQIVDKDNVSTILSALKRILKHDDIMTSSKFYLQLYYQVVLEFDFHIVDDIPTFLGLLVNPENQILVNMLLANCVRKSPKESSEIILLYFQDLIDLGLSCESKLLTFFLALDTIFMYDPVVGAKIYNNEIALSEIVSFITNADLQDADLRKVVLALLNLVSTSSMVAQCRAFTAKKYMDLLRNGTKLELTSADKDFELLLVLSTLCIVKTWNFKGQEIKGDDEVPMPSIAHMSQVLISALNTKDQHVIQASLEGLSYLTLSAQVRKTIRMDVATLDTLIALLDPSKAPKSGALMFYALVVTFYNLTKLPEEKNDTKDFLKSYALPKEAGSHYRETQDEIKLFNRSLLNNNKIVAKLRTHLAQVKSRPDSRSGKLIISIIYYLTLDNLKSTRSTIVEQGGCTLVLEYLFAASEVKDGIVRPRSTDEEELTTRAQALMALAKILILLNPKVIFGKYNLKSSVPFVLELLKTNDEGEFFESEKFTNVQRLESLLALTNLSSDLQDKDLRTFIIEKAFDKYISDLLLETEVPVIQKAAWELVSNLISEPLMLAKFFNLQVKENHKRLEILINLIQSTELDLQVVIAGLLANALSSFQMICDIVLKDHELLEMLLNNIGNVLERQSNEIELVQRLTYALAGFTYNLSDSKEYLERLKRNDQIKRGLRVAATSGDPETLEYIGGVLQAISDPKNSV